jgi:hypothetical protein
MAKYEGDSLNEASEWYFTEIWDRLTCCPCCDRYGKVYYRTIHIGLALCLIELYRAGGETEFIRTPDEDNPLGKAIDPGGRLSKAVLWGLVEMADERGWWTLTPKGTDFVKGLITVPSHVWEYDGHLLKVDDDKRINIRDALDTPFDLEKLLNGEEVPRKPRKKKKDQDD